MMADSAVDRPGATRFSCRSTCERRCFRAPSSQIRHIVMQLLQGRLCCLPGQGHCVSPYANKALIWGVLKKIIRQELSERKVAGTQSRKISQTMSFQPSKGCHRDT